MVEMEKIMLNAKRDQLMESDKWTKEIPFINFKSDWEVKIIPPFGGAVVRFVVKHPKLKQTISVYLDCYGTLGAMDQPYWELYPFEGDVYRVYLNDVDELVEKIQEGFDYLIKESQSDA